EVRQVVLLAEHEPEPGGLSECEHERVGVEKRGLEQAGVALAVAERERDELVSVEPGGDDLCEPLARLLDALLDVFDSFFELRALAVALGYLGACPSGGCGHGAPSVRRGRRMTTSLLTGCSDVTVHAAAMSGCCSRSSATETRRLG